MALLSRRDIDGILALAFDFEICEERRTTCLWMTKDCQWVGTKSYFVLPFGQGSKAPGKF